MTVAVSSHTVTKSDTSESVSEKAKVPDRFLNVAVACTGLGRINRGFETFSRQLADNLSLACGESKVTLFGAHGSERLGAVPVRSLSRDSTLAKHLGRLLRRDSYFAEQATFAAALVPKLVAGRFNVILASDRSLVDLLWYLRRAMRFQYRIIGSNGGPMGPPFCRIDFAHHVLPETYEATRLSPVHQSRHRLLPYGFDIPAVLPPRPSIEQRRHMRSSLGLPIDRRIVITVGAVNTSHKRMDYVVREVASLPAIDRPFLLIVGQREAESPAVEQLASELLGPNGYQIRTVESHEVGPLLAAADAFALGSLYEAFGRVMVEAAACGLPCLVHDQPGSKFILGDCCQCGDFSLTGSLSNLLADLNAETIDRTADEGRHRDMYERFSWDRLRFAYWEMVSDVAELPLLNSFPN